MDKMLDLLTSMDKEKTKGGLGLHADEQTEQKCVKNHLLGKDERGRRC